MKRKPRDNKNFHYYNANPKGLKTGDCRYRAYALATGQSWEVTVLTVALWTVKTGIVDWNGSTIDSVLQEFGNWEKHKEPKHPNGKKYTVAELAKELKDEPNPILVSVNNHMTCIKDKKVWDIWDCSGEYVRNYWTKGESND